MSLKNFNPDRIGGFDAIVMDELREKYPEKFHESGQMNWEWFEKEIRPNNFIYIRKDKNSISFTLQDGPIKEVGVNGCQVDTIIHAAKFIIEMFNDSCPCVQNDTAIYHLNKALDSLHERTVERMKRNVEGTSNK